MTPKPLLARPVDVPEGYGAVARELSGGQRQRVAIARALNHTGAKTRTQVVRALTGQTGLKRKVIDRTGLILEIFGERAATAEGRRSATAHSS